MPFWSFRVADEQSASGVCAIAESQGSPVKSRIIAEHQSQTGRWASENRKQETRMESRYEGRGQKRRICSRRG